jgi:hypothetical protein
LPGSKNGSESGYEQQSAREEVGEWGTGIEIGIWTANHDTVHRAKGIDLLVAEETVFSGAVTSIGPP